MKTSIKNIEIRNIIHFAIFLAYIFIAPLAVFSQQSSEVISNCIKNKEIEKLSKFFDHDVSVSLPSSKDSYIQPEANKFLEQFFIAHPPLSFKIKHQGKSKSNSIYLIGELQTEQNNYRTYILYKEENGKIKISELRIETEK